MNIRNLCREQTGYDFDNFSKIYSLRSWIDTAKQCVSYQFGWLCEICCVRQFAYFGSGMFWI